MVSQIVGKRNYFGDPEIKQSKLVVRAHLHI